MVPIEQIEEILLARAVRASMRVMRDWQGLPVASDVKAADNTLVTEADKACQGAGIEILRQLTHVSFRAEEGATTTGTGLYRGHFDPLDGTNALVVGLATSTVIGAIYDPSSRQIRSCAIGEAATRRIWSANASQGGCRLEYDGVIRPVQVWSGPMDNKTTVFMDVSHGFKRDGRQILTDKQTACLFGVLNHQVKILLPGSNGLTHSLVANGGGRTVGAITLAIGGPWDVAGVLLVLKAGGVAAAFRKTTDGDRHGLEKVDPLDTENYDVLITANNIDTLAALVTSLYHSIGFYDSGL